MRPEAGSPAICLRGLFDALRARGFGVSAATQDGNAEVTEEKSAVGSTGRWDERGIADHAASADVVHIHGWGYRLARSAALAARRLGKPYVISPYGFLCAGGVRKRSWRDKLRGLMSENRVIRAASALTALNEVEERELGTGAVNARIVRLPLGLAVREYADIRGLAQPPGVDGEDRDPSGKIVLLLGPIHPAGGCVPALKAFAEMGTESDGWNIVLAGQEMGDWRQGLEAAIRRKGGENRVLLSPAPHPAAQGAWLKRASVMVVPSLQVQCPASLLQAVASGVPVLASEHVTPSELRDVVVVCRAVRDELKGGLRHLLGLSDEGRARLGQRAHEVLRAVLDWSVLVDRYIEFYQDLLFG